VRPHRVVFNGPVSGVGFEILKAAERINKQRIDRFLEKVHRLCGL
jgi:hypothetical protein